MDFDKFGCIVREIFGEKKRGKKEVEKKKEKEEEGYGMGEGRGRGRMSDVR